MLRTFTACPLEKMLTSDSHRLHKDISAKYIRFGHMGISVMDPKRPDIDRALEALRTGLIDVGFRPTS